MKKKYLALLVIPILFSGCGKSLDYSNVEDTTMETQNFDETTTVLETSSQTYYDTPYSANTVITTINTTNDENINTLVLSETQVTTIETTEETTTHILSAYGDEEQLIELAKSLHTIACEMYWNYYTGSPYPLDYNTSIQNDLGETYFLIDDENIQTLENVQSDWYEIFASSNENPKDFEGHFIEKDNKVYVSEISRGANIYYDYTEITNIVSIVDNEVTFNAVSHYVSPDNNSPMEDKTYEFSIILEDNAYHVGKFTLPY